MTDSAPLSSDETKELADFVLSPTSQAAALYEDYNILGVSKEIGYQAMADRLQAIADQINNGNQTHLKTMLTAQAIMLDGLFGQLCQRALVNDYKVVHTKILGMALKAQRQSARTIETLTMLLDPKRALVVQNNVHLSNQTLSVDPFATIPSPAQRQDHMIESSQNPFGQVDQKKMTNELLPMGSN